ncbi:TetR/AcrR family transcriptional regulator [Wenzhouxiangella marina]|uniref:TetR family transcriptional regulator n=1 Tax=Wenzhouxiangella marina TaxID=1579979 RepID=A0A0K0XUT5_9GAMM|nr:TetR/AcrR family transcriptional regulator [Wenzhouxiangella marina]AKS41381.1 TetR family transcriptional regulator [Wenzhouxiangella marina]MBB6086865.1 TetR/AcrR family transcriptional regulator [Wenzhouxiangella marina]
MNDAAIRDADRTRGQILDAAFDLFIDRGFAAVSIREIAVRSGVTKSLIHHHFGGKEALWEAVKEKAFGQYYQDQKDDLDATDSPGPDLLIRGVTSYFEFLRDNPRVVRLFGWTHLEGDTSCSHLDADLVRLGAQRIRQAQENGLLRDDVNPTHVVTMFISLCTQWFQAREHHRAWPGMGQDQEFLDDFLKVLMEGLLPRPEANQA